MGAFGVADLEVLNHDQLADEFASGGIDGALLQQEMLSARMAMDEEISRRGELNAASCAEFLEKHRQLLEEFFEDHKRDVARLAKLNFTPEELRIMLSFRREFPEIHRKSQVLAAQVAHLQMEKQQAFIKEIDDEYQRAVAFRRNRFR